MQNNSMSPQKLQILMARKSEMNKLLANGENIIDDTHIIISWIKTQRVFSEIAKNLYNDEFLSQRIAEVKTENNRFNNAFDNQSSVQASTFGTMINVTSLKFEHLFSDMSLYKVEELLDLCDITDLSGNTTAGQDKEELKQIIWSIRCAISHNKEYLKAQNLYSALNFTDDANILIDASISGKPVVLKTKIDKLHYFLFQIDESKEQKKSSIFDKAKPFEYGEIEEKEVKKILSDKGAYLSIDYTQPADYYFDINGNFIKKLTAIINSKKTTVIDQAKVDFNLDRRLKMLKTYFRNCDPDCLQPENYKYLTQDISNHLLLNGYLSTMLNTSTKLHEIFYFWDHDKSIDENLNFYVQNGRDSSATERELYVLNDLYPSIVLNVAKFMFTNHERELKSFIELEKQNNSKLFKNIEYKQDKESKQKRGDNLYEKLRNSIHHGRLLIQYPNKTDFDQEDVFVYLFDGEKQHHDFITSLRIRDLACITEKFGMYLINQHFANKNIDNSDVFSV